jgi:hypothetical protein
MEHRGRIQAQGGGLEASESWSSSTPPTKQEGLDLIDKLECNIIKSTKSSNLSLERI